jgi:CubicO group peptidase (beta-lactamase class C family)
MGIRIALLLFLALSLHTQTPDSSQLVNVDKLLAKFTAKSPGCAVGAVQNGKTLLAKGYGLADLEHDAPLTPNTPIYLASVSKQFTAMAVLLLVEDGKLQLSDSVRKIIPELPEYFSAVTIYHLLTHTSGVRDYLALGSLAGWSIPSLNDDGFLRVLSRQRALNFEPGSEFLYSNSGYVLLSLVVKRVAEKNLNDFAQERIFGPLGMTATRYQHNHATLLPGKANGYQIVIVPQVANDMLDTVGDGGIYSTVEDMLRWGTSFDDPKVGAKALATMSTPGKLSSGKNTGKETGYGMGLVPDDYRGLKTVWHNGGFVGYHAQFMHFTGQKFSVVCLCNNTSANPEDLANHVADLFLAADLKAPPEARPARNGTGVALSAEEVQSHTGVFRSEQNGYIELSERNGKLFWRGPGELIALDKQRFTFAAAPEGWELVFSNEAGPGGFEIRPPKDVPVRYERVVQPVLTESQRKEFAGGFYSRELGVVYTIRLRDSDLVVEIGERSTTLLGGGPDRWRTANGSELVFQRDASGKVTGFLVNAGRVRGVQFTRSLD